MPSKTAKQARFMRACLHGFRPGKAKCPPRKVAKEYVMADKVRKGRKGA